MTWYLDTAAAMAALGAVGGLGVPTLIGRIPEPPSEEDEVDEAVKGLSSLMEPFIIVVLGVLIGGIVVSMYLPIFKLGAVV